jgi:uncharacterized protein YndB with AHSA1/START domain
MPGFSRTFTIDASPARVFAVLTDLDQAPQWMPAIQRTEWVTGDKVAPGAVWTEWRKAGPRVMKAQIKVTRFVPAKALDLNVDSKQFGMDLGFDLFPEAAGKATRVEYHCHGKGKGWMSLFSNAIMRQVEKQDADLLQRLKAQVEKA